MSLLCSLTGQVATQPMLNPKSGRVYEKRVIEQHLLTSDTDPNTNEPLSASELIAINPASLSLPPFLSSPSPATLSLSSLLSTLQREYDGVMLEQFSLKREVHSVKQELAHALYQYDAACRVIARLVRERDEAKEALRSASAAAPAPAEAKQPPTTDNRHTAADGDAAMDVDAEKKDGGGSGGAEAAATPSPLKEMTAAFEETSERLGGKKRKAVLKEKAAVAARKEDVAQYAATQSFTLHGAATPGVTAVDVDERAEGEQRLLLTGGVDGSVLLFDARAGKVRDTIKGHSKRVTAVAFVQPASSPPSAAPLPLLSSSADASVHLYTRDADSGHYAVTRTWSDHTAAITCLSLHPSGLYFATSSLDSTYRVYSTASSSPSPVLSTTTPSPLTSLAFHPDGRILATSHHDQHVRIYDALQSLCVVSLTAHTAPPVALAFSPNGYQAASGDEGGVVRVWDLRKVSGGEKECNIATVTVGGVGGGGGAGGLGVMAFDEGGGMLGVGLGGGQVVVVEGKAWGEVARWKEHKDEVRGMRWGRNGHCLVTASKDRTVKVWSKKDSAA